MEWSLHYWFWVSFHPSLTATETIQTKRKALTISEQKTEIETVVAEKQIREAIISKMSPATKYLIKTSDTVRVYREKAEMGSSLHT